MVLASDAAVIAARRVNTSARSPRAERSPSVLFRDDFSSSSPFRPSDDDDVTSTVDGTYHLRFKGVAGRDTYDPVPEAAPANALIERTQDLSVAVDVRSPSGDDVRWFGVFCRFAGLDHDLYRATVRPDGQWTIDRTTLGTETYTSRTLLRGSLSGVAGMELPGFTFRVRLQCTGRSPTVLQLFVNDQEVGAATDEEGLDPGRAGVTASSLKGEFLFDNLVVTERR